MLLPRTLTALALIALSSAALAQTTPSAPATPPAATPSPAPAAAPTPPPAAAAPKSTTPCIGYDEATCRTNEACIWLKGYSVGPSKQVPGYCRPKPMAASKLRSRAIAPKTPQ